jgi:hypothetical protein
MREPSRTVTVNVAPRCRAWRRGHHFVVPVGGPAWLPAGLFSASLRVAVCTICGAYRRVIWRPVGSETVAVVEYFPPDKSSRRWVREIRLSNSR